MTKEQALLTLDRVERWERNASKRLRDTILVPYFGGNMCCLHNWMINFENGNRHITKEAYDKGRYYTWKQNQIWATSRRLRDHFYNVYLTQLRKEWH